MTFSNPYTLYLFISAIIALITASFAWRRRFAPGASPLFLMLITMSIWAGANGMVLETQDPRWQIFWFDVLTFGAIMGTPAFWAFGVEFTQHGHWLKPRNILLISIIPVLSVILGWTTEYHGLFYAERDLSTRLPNGSWNFAVGPFYWVYITYSYSVALFTLWLIVRFYIRSSRMLRGQTATILIGTLVPLVGNILYNLVVGTGSGEIDPTPLLFTGMGVIYAYGLFRYRLFDVVPIARHTLIEHMQDGVIVVDDRNRIVDVNPSALRSLNWTEPSPIGENIHTLLRGWFDKISSFPTDLYIQTEVQSANENRQYFDLRLEPLLGNKGSHMGRLIVFRDITRQKLAEQGLQDANDRLKLQLKEIEDLHVELREQAIRDPLTGVFNRRYMMETLEREISHAARSNSPIGVCMADIDNFKSLNDRYGHEAGDHALQKVAETLVSLSRAEDVVCRYGGEEFLILLPGADLAASTRRAEEWRKAIENNRIEFKGNILTCTLSLGVAVFPQQGQTANELLKMADEALYQSKHNGRNRVSVSHIIR